MEDKVFYITKKVICKRFCLSFLALTGLVLFFLMLHGFLETGIFFTILKADYSPCQQMLKLSAFVIICSILICLYQSQVVFSNMRSLHDERQLSKDDYIKYAGISLGIQYPIYHHLIKDITVETTPKGSVIKISYENRSNDTVIKPATLYPENYGLTAKEMLKYFPDCIPVTYK